MFGKLPLGVVAALVVSLGLAGCGEEITASTTLKRNSPPLEHDSSRLMVSDSGVGKIDALTPFNFSKIAKHFPDLNVTEQLNYQKNHKFPAILVAKGPKTLFTINPTTDLNSIYSVVVEDNLVANSQHHRIGTLFSDIYADREEAPTCQAGADDLAGKVLCYPPHGQKLLYMFLGKWSGPASKLPPQEILSGWALDAIIWKPS